MEKTKTKQSKFCRHTFFAPVNRLFFRLFFVLFTSRGRTFLVERSDNRKYYWFRRLQTNQLRFL